MNIINNKKIYTNNIVFLKDIDKEIKNLIIKSIKLRIPSIKVSEVYSESLN